MTRRTNAFFLVAGAAGFALLFAAAGINALLVFSGFDNQPFQAFLQAVMPVWLLLSFVFLAWFGVMPKWGTWLFLNEKLDQRASEVLTAWPLRFMFLIEDDPRVIAKLGRAV